MKAKIKVTYFLHDQEGLPPKIEQIIRKKMKEIGAKFYGSGFDRTNGERDLTFNILLKEK